MGQRRQRKLGKKWGGYLTSFFGGVVFFESEFLFFGNLIDFGFERIEAFHGAAPIKLLLAAQQGNSHESDDKAEDDDAGGFENDANNAAGSSDGVIIAVADAGDGGEGPPNAIFYCGEFGVGIEGLFDGDDGNTEGDGEEDEDGEKKVEAMAFENVAHTPMLHRRRLGLKAGWLHSFSTV